MRKRFIEGGEIRAAQNSEGLREIGGAGGGEGEGGGGGSIVCWRCSVPV